MCIQSKFQFVVEIIEPRCSSLAATTNWGQYEQIEKSNRNFYYLKIVKSKETVNDTMFLIRKYISALEILRKKGFLTVRTHPSTKKFLERGKSGAKFKSRA